MKTVLFIAAGIEAVHGIRRAKKLGLHVVASDVDPQAPGFADADDHLIASTYDAEETKQAAIAYQNSVRPIDGVLSIGADVPLTVATVADALGAPGLSLDAAHMATDKLAMKKALWAAGVAVPWFSGVDSGDHLKAIAAGRREPLVLKPVDSRGSRGVVRLSSDVDLTWAFDQARNISPTNRVMVETYLHGPQLSTESLILSGEYITPGFSDRNYEYLERYAPYFIENGGDLPSQLSDEIKRKTETLIARAARALSMTHGTVKGDIVIHNNEPHIIELAPRLSGGYFCSLEIPLSTGVDFVGIAIRLALGETIHPDEGRPQFQKPVVQRYLFPNSGKITAIEGIEAARQMPGVAHLIVSGQIGQTVGTTIDSTSRAAMVLVEGADLSQARRNAENALSKIRVKTQTSSTGSTVSHNELDASG